jgi:TolB protein
MATILARETRSRHLRASFSLGFGQVQAGCADGSGIGEMPIAEGAAMRVERMMIVVGAAAAVVGALAGPDAASAASGTTVAYVRGGVIYVSTGTVERRLTEDQVNARPRFAPDGKRIAYLHNNTVWVMNADGSAKRQVSDRVGGGPTWSPDGKWIAFASQSCTGGPGVYRVSSTVPAPAPQVLFPASCRGQVIPQMASISGMPGANSLAEKLRHDGAVAWSPDGTKIAFPGGECESIADACLTVGTVASGAERAVDVYGGGGNGTGGFGVVPSWRVDGKKLSWTAYTDGGVAVHVQEADPSGANRHSIGQADDREMTYLGTGTGVLTAKYQNASWITLVDLATGRRTPYRVGSQPTVAR